MLLLVSSFTISSAMACIFHKINPKKVCKLISSAILWRRPPNVMNPLQEPNRSKSNTYISDLWRTKAEKLRWSRRHYYLQSNRSILFSSLSQPLNSHWKWWKHHTVFTALNTCFTMLFALNRNWLTTITGVPCKSYHIAKLQK